ncbi:hypothetical protein P4S72_15695 [Vibrio sp. PP-XX7]
MYQAYQLILLFGLSVPFTAAVGYFFDAKPLYLEMSLPTVIICFMVACSGLAMSAHKGVIRVIFSPKSNGNSGKNSVCVVIGLLRNCQHNATPFFN